MKTKYKPIMYDGTKSMVMDRLIEQLEKGPSFSILGTNGFDLQIAIEQYRSWAATWIIPDLKELFTRNK